MAMATTSGEKVKCGHCEKTLKKKNLKEHTKNVHGEGAKVKLVSLSSANIRGIFDQSPPKTVEENMPPEQEGQGASSAQPPQINQTDYILAQLESLHLKVDQLEKQESQPKFVINTTDLSSVLNEKNMMDLS